MVRIILVVVKIITGNLEIRTIMVVMEIAMLVVT